MSGRHRCLSSQGWHASACQLTEDSIRPKTLRGGGQSPESALQYLMYRPIGGKYADVQWKNLKGQYGTVSNQSEGYKILQIHSFNTADFSLSKELSVLRPIAQ